jgi:hypothetical protein
LADHHDFRTQAIRQDVAPQVRTSFSEEKEAKRLLRCWAMGDDGTTAHGPANQKFLRRFF